MAELIESELPDGYASSQDWASPDTPPLKAAHERPPAGRGSVAVFGAGIAGLTAAHELAERGFNVTVYEPAADPRPDGLRGKPWDLTVRLGGIAATQYLIGDRLRRFPQGDESGPVRMRPESLTSWPPVGEHGFRFFPAYYLHLWDTLDRIPVFDDPRSPDAKVTPRTVYDNVQRVITQAMTSADGRPSLIVPREAPRSIAEMIGALGQIPRMGFTPNDMSTFLGRVARYLVTSPDRRSRELEDVPTIDYLHGVNRRGSPVRFRYGQAFEQQMQRMPRVLAAFDAKWGDTRTNLNTWVQLNQGMDRYDSKADGVLCGPTTEAWFDHWHRHLKNLGVEFEHATLKQFRFEDGELRAFVARGNALDEDLDVDLNTTNRVPALGNRLKGEHSYYLVATDAFRAELATAPLREYKIPPAIWTRDMNEYRRELSTVLGLHGWATSVAPKLHPHDPDRSTRRRNPLRMKEMGAEAWDRYQTIAGIQFFFDTEFEFVRGHVYFAQSEWGLSAINQTGFWTNSARLARDGYGSLMSVDIGDWNTKSTRTGRSARDCTADQIAEEVWHQITHEFLQQTARGGVHVDHQFPVPVWYAIDEFIRFAPPGSTGGETPEFNGAPYLIPIVGDWRNRPGSAPWNPHGSSLSRHPSPDMSKVQEECGVWQAAHGGYEVHFDKLVFAGTWCKTFTRMTTMESACESARHAVNAILDHHLHVRSGGVDARDEPALSWRMPFGFVDQELSSPIRFPTPAGDYCFIFDCESREPADARETRRIDAKNCRAGLPHPWDIWGVDTAAATLSSLAVQYADGAPYDPTRLIVEQLRQWRALMDAVNATPPPARGFSEEPPPLDYGSLLRYEAGDLDVVYNPPGDANLKDVIGVSSSGDGGGDSAPTRFGGIIELPPSDPESPDDPAPDEVPIDPLRRTRRAGG